MALNPDYVPMTPMWELHSDKDTGEFLRSGYAKFAIDTARTVGKPVYKITGSPPNYTYIADGFFDTDGLWRVDLNDQGAFDDILYGYVLDEAGDTELYYVQFFSMDDVPQFTREGWPNFISDGEGPTQQVDVNYIPNGQFRLHLDLPVATNYLAGQVRSPITRCAFGGWTFERPVGSTARDFVTFDRFAAYTPSPDKSPRYQIRIECESPSAGDAYKDLRIKFDDVNKFASTTDEFTFAISGKFASGGAINVDLVLIKNFGTGGDTATETTLTTFALTSSYQIFYHAFSFGTNVGKSIGGLNDDYIQLALRFPVDNIFDVVFDDAILTQGNVASPVFDDTTTREFIYRSIFSNVCPNPDGSDLYLPVTLSPDGLIPDTSVIGSIIAKGTYAVSKGELECDGSMFETESYSADGIPYSRLFNKFFLEVSTSGLPMGIPLFGTGLPFLTADILSTKDLKISTNTKGSTATPSDGGTPTGFTFRSNHVGQIDVTGKAYLSDGNSFVIFADKIGTVTGFDAGTSGATAVENVNGPAARYTLTVTLVSGLGAGGYFAFALGNNGGAEQIVLVWFKVDGVGTIPSYPSATATVEIDLFTDVNFRDEVKIISDSISGKQVSQITCVAASSITAGSYFIVDTLTQSYYVWYQKDGVGTDPAPSGKLGIKVSIAGTDTKDQVTTKTATAINSKYYAVPNLRGLMLKGIVGVDPDPIDLDHEERFALNSVVSGNTIGTREYSNNISHHHTQLAGTLAGATGTGFFFYGYNQDNRLGNNYTDIPISNDGTETRPLIQYQGGVESRPQNIYVNYFIKY
jgi:hypothetical protein